MRNNAAYLPESPIVYIILPKSIRNRASFTIFVTFPHSIMLMNQILKTRHIEVVDAPGRVFGPESLSFRMDTDRMGMYKSITGIWFCNKK